MASTITGQEQTQYGVPRTRVITDKTVRGKISSITRYQTEINHQSLQGGDTWRRTEKTLFKIFPEGGAGALEFSFPGFVGPEVVGKRVRYNVSETHTETFFDPTGRENDPTFRSGKLEVIRSHALLPLDGVSFPVY